MASFLNLIAKIIRAVVDSLAAILGLYYSTKYAAIIRRLGLPLVEPSERRGFVVLQIDGLAYIHLLEAIERGYAPYLQRLLRRGEFRLHPWRVGLPCTTPAVQAGIMFGNNDEIPAFRWYDKKAGLLIDCAQPAPVHAIQERIASLRPGILTGGSSYMNMFDGGASLSMFTLGAWNSKHFFENVKGLGFLILFLLNPFRSLKMFILAIWEYFTDLVQHTMALLKQRTPHPLQRKFRFLRVVSNVVFREIQTFAVMIDIYRGVPAIYATYYGYDEVAHHYGPLSKPALRALHAIDRRIRRIDGLRRLALTREYDLYILSDHGMTSATPFKRVFGGTLGELARDCADD
ncbi:MAG: alkaline phosphatase family protein, partial [Chloroflexi bacterium]|nr:alkaline phosphatase family protein [Chloroflexota bacterium]